MAAIICVKCGAEVPEHALYCPKCGKKIPEPFTGKSADSKVGTIVGVVGCLIILAGLIVVFILLMASID